MQNNNGPLLLKEVCEITVGLSFLWQYVYHFGAPCDILEPKCYNQSG